MLLGYGVYRLTKNGLIAYGVALAAMAATVAAMFTDDGALTSLLPTLMEKLSLFSRFTSFVNGVFDVTAIVFWLSVAAFFLFLTVQSLEKRRYS